MWKRDLLCLGWNFEFPRHWNSDPRLEPLQSYIWTLCAKVVLSVRTLGPIQSELQHFRLILLLLLLRQQVVPRFMRSERLCKDLALVFENVPFVVNHKRKRLCRSNGRLFHIVVVSRSKAVWINFHGKQLSKRKEFEWNLANLSIHAHIYRFMQIWKNPHKTWLNKQIRQQWRDHVCIKYPFCWKLWCGYQYS